MDARDKEQYLREYYILKGKGKPFFPYAVFKDGAMACIVMLVIIVMSIVLGGLITKRDVGEFKAKMSTVG